jgi:hypothetical protein
MPAPIRHDIKPSFAELSSLLRQKTQNSILIAIQLQEPSEIEDCISLECVFSDETHFLYKMKPSSSEDGTKFRLLENDIAILKLVKRYKIELAAN